MVIKMKKIKILLTRKYHDIDIAYIKEKLQRQIGDNYTLVNPKNYEEEYLIKVISDVDVLLGPYVSESLIKQATNLKLIQIPWTGIENFNFKVMEGSFIPVCNSHSNASAVAEFAIALTLNIIKKINFHDNRMRKNDWNRMQERTSLKSRMINNSNVCILGYGNIGRRIGIMLNALGANIKAVTKSIQKYPEAKELFISKDWEVAVKGSNIIICTLPLTDATRNLINHDTIANFSKDSIIVNVSRAEIFNEEAIYSALADNRISGYASDVWWKNPSRDKSNSSVSSTFLFEELDNVLLSPHRAGFVEGSLPHLDDAIENITNVFLKKRLINVVNIEKRY